MPRMMACSLKIRLASIIFGWNARFKSRAGAMGLSSSGSWGSSGGRLGFGGSGKSGNGGSPSWLIVKVYEKVGLKA